MPSRYLVDTNVIIEAVRTKCWRAITGGLEIETVAACRDEVLAGSAASIPDYVTVTNEDLDRLTAVHGVDKRALAALELAYPDADALDAGEQGLLAHALEHVAEDWLMCSPDKAAIRAAVALGFGDRLVALEEIAARAGARAPGLYVQFGAAWLRDVRTRARLGMR
jgi:hypothetical protein